MFITPESASPFEWFTQHIQLVGWGTVLLGVYKGTRFLTRAMARIDTVHKKVDEVHSAVTNGIAHGIARQVELAEKQDRRWEMWMSQRAFAHGGGVITAEEVHIHDAESDIET